MNRKRYTDAFKEQVVKDRKENCMSEREVAEKYGIAKSTVHSWTTAYYSKGQKKQNNGALFTKEQKEKAVLEYVYGKTKKEIANEQGISLWLLNEWVEDYFERKEQEIAQEKKIEKEEKRPRIFRDRNHRDRKGNLLKTVYPSSSAAYVNWAK